MATTVPNTTVPPRFSPWLSLAAPHLCPDEGGKDGTMTPYAVLHLFLDRAHGLPPADLNGLSDPYVTAQINDMDVDVRSRTQNNTLAPRWGQSFYISVYRPESIQVARSGRDMDTKSKQLGWGQGLIDWCWIMRQLDAGYPGSNQSNLWWQFMKAKCPHWFMKTVSGDSLFGFLETVCEGKV